jgi:hypothetical protein
LSIDGFIPSRCNYSCPALQQPSVGGGMRLGCNNHAYTCQRIPRSCIQVTYHSPTNPAGPKNNEPKERKKRLNSSLNTKTQEIPKGYIPMLFPVLNKSPVLSQQQNTYSHNPSLRAHPTSPRVGRTFQRPCPRPSRHQAHSRINTQRFVRRADCHAPFVR